MIRFLIGGSAFATIVSVASLVTIIFGVNPDDSTWWHIAIFYVSLFLILVGILFMIFVYLKKKFKKPILIETIHHPFRQSFFLSGFVAGLMILHQFNRLNIISLVALLVFTSAMEIYFLRMRQ